MHEQHEMEQDSERERARPHTHVLLVLAAFVVVMAGMKAAAELVVPFLMAAFLAVVAATPTLWLERRGLRPLFAILAVLGVISAAFAVMGAIVAQSVNTFMAHLPEYEARTQAIVQQAIAFAGSHGIAIDPGFVRTHMDPAAVMPYLGSTLQGFGGALSNSLLILFTVVFILLEASSFPHKLRAILRQPDESMPHFARFAETVNRYMAIKTAISLVTGTLVAAWLALLGVDFPVLWGLLTFLLNYVPSFGSFLAGVPPVLLALLQLGPLEAALAAGGISAINIALDNFVAPRFMGRGLGLSTLVVFVSLIFWGWILGPVGMVLSVPLTITAKIALEVNPGTVWLAVLLGPEDDYAGAPPLPADPAGSTDVVADGETIAARAADAAVTPPR